MKRHSLFMIIGAAISALALVSHLPAADVMPTRVRLPITNIQIDASGNQKFTPESKLADSKLADQFGGPPILIFTLSGGTWSVIFTPKTLEFRDGVPVIICESGHEFTTGFISNELHVFAIVKDKEMDEIVKVSKDELSKLCATLRTIDADTLDAYYKWLQKDVTEAVDARVSKTESAEEKKRALQAFACMIIHPALQKALKGSQ